MDSHSQELLRRVEQNDDKLIQLIINPQCYFGFKSSVSSHYSTLGRAIGNNSRLTKLKLEVYHASEVLDITNIEFFDGLKRNSSISDLDISLNNLRLVGGVGHELLKSYQNIKNNLTRLCIYQAVLDNGGGNAITETLRWCRNLKTINLDGNLITDEQLLPIVEAIKEVCYTSLEKVVLEGNSFGNAGCEAIATLLDGDKCNIAYLDLNNNQIGNKGAIAIANSLVNNTKLKSLDLNDNSFDQLVVEDTFCRVLCNTSCINDIYMSNHTLMELSLSDDEEHAESLLVMNRSTIPMLGLGLNKSDVAKRKILHYHPNIDMEPLFEWDAEGEQTLKALPYVIGWFERAKAATDYLLEYDDCDDDDDYKVEEKMLFAIFQFAKAMPLLFVNHSIVTIFDRKVRDKLEKENAQLKALLMSCDMTHTNRKKIKLGN